MAPVRKTDDRLADPDVEGLLAEEEEASQVPDDERVVPTDADELVVEDDSMPIPPDSFR
jgi:hypothetical protein